MDFELDQEQRDLCRRVREKAVSVAPPAGDAPPGSLALDAWRSLAPLIAGLPVPEASGGEGRGVVDTMVALEALGESCADGGLAFSLAAHLVSTVIPVWLRGSEEQKDRFLRPLARGELIGADAITEAAAGSDVYAMETKAVRNGDDWVLDGEKRYVTNAPIADLFVIFAMTEPARRSFGASAFLVPRDTPGLTVTPGSEKTGLRNVPWGTVSLEGCRLPAAALLGKINAGSAIFRESMIWERGCLFAIYVGAMARSLAACREHARSRRQFGQRIGAFQSVSNRLVDMRLRLETSRLLLYKAGWLHEHGHRADEAVALAKLWISESAVQNGLDAIQLFGARGVEVDSGVDALLRNSLPACIFAGTSDIQRALIARHMGLS